MLVGACSAGAANHQGPQAPDATQAGGAAAGPVGAGTGGAINAGSSGRSESDGTASAAGHGGETGGPAAATGVGGTGQGPIGTGGILGGNGGPAGSGTAGIAGAAAGTGGKTGTAAAGATGGGGSGATASDITPVYRIPLRLHMAMSQLTNGDLAPILQEVNEIWLSQAGICFEMEVTNDEANRSDGLDFRYTSGQIPGAPTANGLTQGAHSIWSIDHPSLGAAPHPVQNPAARTTAHELGHALNLAHENPAPSTDCASPCYCVTLNLDCNDFLLRSGTKGYFLSSPEIGIARASAAQKTLPDTTPLLCAAPVYNR